MLKKLRRRLTVIFTAFTGAVLTAVLIWSFALSSSQLVANNELWFSNTVDKVVSVIVTSMLSEEEPTLDTGDFIVYIKVDDVATTGILANGGQNEVVPPEEQAAMFAQAKDISEERGLTDWVTENYLYVVSATDEDSVAVESDNVAAGTASPSESETEDSMTAIFSGGFYSIAVTPSLGTAGIFEMDYEGTPYRATYFSWNMESESEGGYEEHFYEVAVLESLAGQTRELWLSGLLHLLVWAGGLTLLFLANWFLSKLVIHSTEEGLRRQTQFVAAASHELRSPLAVIRASLSAEETADDEEQAQKFRTAAIEEAERMSRLIDDLLLLAGSDAGSWPLNKSAVDVDTILIDLSEGYAPLAKEKGVRLKLDLPEMTLPKVQGDSQRLRQILAVLLDNALQYAPQDSSIDLSATARKGKVSICVADHGPGIAEDEKDKVFERFYQADQSRHDKDHFGLGLSIAKELAELHGGRLRASDTEGGGATFTLVLPAAS